MKHLTNTFQNCQRHEKQGKTEKLSKIKGDSGDMNKCDAEKENGDVTENYM